MAIYIVLLGPPGVGKGTQATILAEKAGLPHVSSGDLFRENIEQKTELGVLAETFINKGELVPDDVTIGMIRSRLHMPDCEKGAVLDGFPRTIVQAQALDSLLEEFNGKVNFVPYIKAPDHVLVERLSGRWTCKENGHIYHEKFNPPNVPGICDEDKSDLYQREDDKLETVLRRIAVYGNRTMPLIEYYTQRNLLSEVDGAQEIEKVTADLLAVIE